MVCCLDLCPQDFFFFKDREKKGRWKRNRKLSSGATVSKTLGISSVELFWDVLVSLGPAAWEDHEPADTLKMGLNTQIPFASFLFGSPCPWLSPPFCLSILSNNTGMETANLINEWSTYHCVLPSKGERFIVRGCKVFVMYSEGWK